MGCTHETRADRLPLTERRSQDSLVLIRTESMQADLGTVLAHGLPRPLKRKQVSDSSSNWSPLELPCHVPSLCAVVFCGMERDSFLEWLYVLTRPDPSRTGERQRTESDHVQQMISAIPKSSLDMDLIVHRG
jgi:hypothetical protein